MIDLVSYLEVVIATTPPGVDDASAVNRLRDAVQRTLLELSGNKNKRKEANHDQPK